MLTCRQHIANANEYFATGRWWECVYSLLEALPDVEEDENWLLASALLAQLGHCSTRAGCYSQASVAFHRAQMMLKRSPRCRFGELEILQRWTAEASENEVSKDELWRLNERFEAMIAEGKLDEAEDLCDREYKRGCTMLGENNWYNGMIKVLQARCKLGRIMEGMQVRGAGFEEESKELLADAAQLYDEARALVGPEHPEWRAKVEQAATQIETFSQNQGEDESFAAASDWTPDGDREQASEPEAAVARPGLRNYSQPFHSVRLVLSQEAEKLLRPADELFTRREYRMCLRAIEGIQAALQERIDSIVSGLALVLGARCYRAQGSYETALALVQEAVESFRLARTTVSNQLADQLDELGSELDADALLQKRLRGDIVGGVSNLITKGQLLDASDLCDYHLRLLVKEVGSQHWLLAGVQILKADVLVTGAEKVGGEQRDEILQEVQELLRTAEGIVEGFGHDAVWVKRGADCQRERMQSLPAV